MNRQHRLFLSVYVDDFKMAGQDSSMITMWKELKRDIDLEPATPFHGNTYLGCGQKTAPVKEDIVKTKNTLFRKLVKADRQLEKFSTSQGSETDASDVEQHLIPRKKAKAKAKAKNRAKSQPPSSGASGNVERSAAFAPQSKKTKAYQYEMAGHAEQCVDRYCELANADVSELKRVATPCMDDAIIPPEDFEHKGNLSPVASRIVLKVLSVSYTHLTLPTIYSV